jgi:methyl-accepting chemotaxis protein
MFDALEKVTKQAAGNIDAAAIRAVASYRQALTVSLLIMAATILIGLALTVKISSKIAAPLRMLVDNLNSAAEGDLTTHIPYQSEDEVGQVSSAFNAFMHKLRDALNTVAESSAQLSAATVEISKRAAQATGNAQLESSKTAHIATAAEQMTATIGEIGHNTEKAADASRQSAEAAQQGGDVMQAAYSTMEKVAADAGLVSEKMSSLAHRSDEIGKVIHVIQEISEQTNLLALNAAIESARAGEQGRGFAVVAGEVRRLAERTKGATEEVSAAIRSIQEETQATLELMQNSSASVSSGLEETARAQSSLQSIIDSSRQVEGQIQLIASAAMEQTTASAEISRSAGEISQLSVETSRGAGEASTALSGLVTLANQLDTVIHRFRLQ